MTRQFLSHTMIADSRVEWRDADVSNKLGALKLDLIIERYFVSTIFFKCEHFSFSQKLIRVMRTLLLQTKWGIVFILFIAGNGAYGKIDAWLVWFRLNRTNKQNESHRICLKYSHLERIDETFYGLPNPISDPFCIAWKNKETTRKKKLLAFLFRVFPVVLMRHNLYTYRLTNKFTH